MTYKEHMNIVQFSGTRKKKTRSTSHDQTEHGAMNRMALDRQMSVVYFDCKIKPRERAGITGNDIHRLILTRINIQ